VRWGAKGELSPPRDRQPEFEPDVATGVVNSPPARECIHDVEPVPADSLEVVLANDPLEALAMVGDFD
jgi:hypothetical protein